MPPVYAPYDVIAPQVRLLVVPHENAPVDVIPPHVILPQPTLPLPRARLEPLMVPPVRVSQ